MPSRSKAPSSGAETEAPQRRTEAARAETAVAATPEIDSKRMSPYQILQLILEYGDAIIGFVPADILDEILRYCSEQEREYILSILSDNQVFEVLKSYRYNTRKNKEGEYDFPNLRKKVRSFYDDVKRDAENVANMHESDLRVVFTALTGFRPPTNIKKTKLVEMTVLALRAPDARKPDRQEDFQDDFSDVDEIVSVAEHLDTDTKHRGKLFFHCSALTLKDVIQKTGAKATESPHRATIVENAHQLFASIQHLTNDELVNLNKIALFGLARSLGLQVKWANKKDDLKDLIVNFRNSEEMGGDSNVVSFDAANSTMSNGEQQREVLEETVSPSTSTHVRDYSFVGDPPSSYSFETPPNNQRPVRLNDDEGGLSENRQSVAVRRPDPVDGTNSFSTTTQRGRDPTPTQDPLPSRGKSGQKSTGVALSPDPRPPSLEDDRNNINSVNTSGVTERDEDADNTTATANPQAALEDDAASFNNGNSNGDNDDLVNLTRQLVASHIESNRNYQTQFAQGQEQICLLSTRVDQEAEKNRTFRGEMRGKLGEVEARLGQDGARLGKAESDIAGLKGDIDPLQRTVEKLLRKTGVSPASTKRVLFSTDGGGIEQASGAPAPPPSSTPTGTTECRDCKMLLPADPDFRCTCNGNGTKVAPTKTPEDWSNEDVMDTITDSGKTPPTSSASVGDYGLSATLSAEHDNRDAVNGDDKSSLSPLFSSPKKSSDGGYGLSTTEQDDRDEKKSGDVTAKGLANENKKITGGIGIDSSNTATAAAGTKIMLTFPFVSNTAAADVDTNGYLAPLTLEVPGSREFVEADKAREVVALWTEQLTAHRQEVQAIVGDATTLEDVVLCDGIRLSDKSFSNEAAVIIAAFLTAPFMGGRSVASGILNAELDDIIAGRGPEMGLHVLQTICDAFADSNLVNVNLSDNAIGQQGIGACNTVLSKPSLERLALCNNGLSEDTMAEVADILTRDEFGTGCVAANLTKIHFYNNMSGEGGCQHFARILEKSSKLTDIRFSGTRAGKDGSDTVASAFAVALEEGRNAGLQKLDFCDNNFGNEASQDALFRALQRTPSLKYLDLRDCELEDAGIERVCDALYESNSALEHLDLSGNNVEPSGAERIAYYISNRGGELKVLCLDDNDLTSQGVKDIAHSIAENATAIERLQLNYTMCGDIGANALLYADWEGRNLPNLNKICLDGNKFTEVMVKTLEGTFGDKLVEMEENDPDGEEGDDAGEDEDGDVDALDGAMGNLWN